MQLYGEDPEKMVLLNNFYQVSIGMNWIF
jgi:hypothetical protein